MSVKLSVSIVAYNDYEDIKNALTSIGKYTSSELSKKVFIVDNGVAVSDPKDVKEFKSYLEKTADVEYIDAGRNAGFGKGHNMVMPVMDSEYHAIVNPDILLCEDAFSKIVEWMDANKDIGMVIPNIINEKGNKQEVYRRELTAFDLFNRRILKGFFRKRFAWHIMADMDFSKPFQVPFGQGSFLVVRTELFKELSGFDENFFMYCEDADLCRRVNQVSKLMYYPGTKVIHKWEAGSHRNKTLFKYHVQSMKYYFKKWGWKMF